MDTTHVLTTPEFTGNGEERSAALSYWSSAVSLYGQLAELTISPQNKLSLIGAMRRELDLVEQELSPAAATAPAPPPAVPQAAVGGAPGTLVSPPTPTLEVEHQKDLQQEEGRRQQAEAERKQRLERLQRAAGTFYLSKRVSVLETHPRDRDEP